MPRSFKLAILRARHSRAFTPIPDSACRAFLVDAPDRSSVLQYWTDATMGHVRFDDAWMFPWVDITADPTNEHQASRGFLASAAVAATEALGHDLSGYHGFLVLTPPGTTVLTALDGSTRVVGFDAGASNFVDGRRFCVVHTTSSHTFDTHELGHVIGYGHTHGLLNNGVDWEGVGATSTEYGSPYDIMSALAFGSKWAAPPTWSSGPTFARTDLATVNPGWPSPECWHGMGPLPARAHVYLHDAQGLLDANVVRHATLNGSQGLASGVLWSAGKLERERASLLVVRDERSGSPREYCIEYRGLDGWDQGLDGSGPDVARRAVLVHSIEGEGAGRHAHYRGRIVVPVEIDADLAIEGTDLHLRVVGTDATLSSVSVMLGSLATRHVMLDHETRTEEHVTSSAMREVKVPHCGVESFPWQRALTRVELRASVRAFGFAGKGAPEVGEVKARWQLGDAMLETPGVGTIAARTREGRTVSLDYELSERAQALTLRSRFEADPFIVDVRASVREPDDSHETWSAMITLWNDGTTEGFGPGLGQAIERCLPHAPRELRLFPGCTPPEWFRHVRIEIPRPVLGPEIPGGPLGPEAILDELVRPGPSDLPGLRPASPVLRETLEHAEPLIRERLEPATRELLRGLIRPAARR